MRKKNVTAISWAGLALMLLTACARPEITASTQIAPGRSLVIGSTFEEIFLPRGSLFSSEPRTNYYNNRVVFRRFDPTEPKWSLSWRGRRNKYTATDALPGKYHFFFFDSGSTPVSYVFEPHNQRFELDVQEGEAVYIGDVVVETTGNRFRIDIRDNEAAARAHFDEKFSDSGLKFTKRLMRRVRRLEPVLPK